MNMIQIYEYIKFVWIKKMCQNLYNTLNIHDTRNKYEHDMDIWIARSSWWLGLKFWIVILLLNYWIVFFIFILWNFKRNIITKWRIIFLLIVWPFSSNKILIIIWMKNFIIHEFYTSKSCRVQFRWTLNFFY